MLVVAPVRVLRVRAPARLAQIMFPHPQSLALGLRVRDRLLQGLVLARPLLVRAQAALGPITLHRTPSLVVATVVAQIRLVPVVPQGPATTPLLRHRVCRAQVVAVAKLAPVVPVPVAHVPAITLSLQLKVCPVPVARVPIAAAAKLVPVDPVRVDLVRVPVAQAALTLA